MLMLAFFIAVLVLAGSMARIIPGPIGGHTYIGASPVFITNRTHNKGVRLAEVTTTGTPGTAYQGVRQDPNWFCELPLDDAAAPEVIGWQGGNVIPVIYFKKGSSSLCDKLENTTIESVDEILNAQNDVIRIRVSGRGGFFTPNVLLGA